MLPKHGKCTLYQRQGETYCLVRVWRFTLLANSSTDYHGEVSCVLLTKAGALFRRVVFFMFRILCIKLCVHSCQGILSVVACFYCCAFIHPFLFNGEFKTSIILMLFPQSWVLVYLKFFTFRVYITAGMMNSKDAIKFDMLRACLWLNHLMF